MRLSLFRAVFFCGLFLQLCAGQSNAAGILVLSPHPDDDVLIASGVISNAISQGQPVKVVYVTNGDYVSKSQGYFREGEAVTGQSYLGTTENNLIFLGYPDGYLKDIYLNYVNSTDHYVSPNGQDVTYGNRGLGLHDYHTYRFGSPALYNRYNIVADLQDIISTYRPDHIYTTSEIDDHPDHLHYLQSAQARARGGIAAPIQATNPSYTRRWSISISDWPAPADPTAYNIHNESEFAAVGLQWNNRESLDVPLPMQSTNTATNPKYLAIGAHASQGGNTGLFGKISA